MINNNSLYQTVAEAVSVKFDGDTGEIFLTFRIIDENLKQKIKKDWSADIEFELVGKSLREKE